MVGEHGQFSHTRSHPLCYSVPNLDTPQAKRYVTLELIYPPIRTEPADARVVRGRAVRAQLPKSKASPTGFVSDGAEAFATAGASILDIA